MPGFELTGDIGPKHKNNVGLGLGRGKFGDGIDGVAGASTIDLYRRDNKLGIARNRFFNHGQPVFCWGYDAVARLLPRVVGHDQPHLIQIQLMPGAGRK